MPLTIQVKPPTYLDGILKYYKVTYKYNEAKKKVGKENFFMGKLNFELVTKRQQDYDFAEANSKKLDIKVKIPKVPFDTEYLVEINSIFYECYLCEDSDKFSNYLYLQKVKL